MSDAFTKIYGDKLLSSSLLLESLETRWVFIGMLSLANEHGIVDVPSVRTLAHRLNVSVDGLTAALAVLEAPDPESRTPDEDGRRIVREGNVWRVVNHRAYRDLRSTAQEKTRERVAKHRERKRYGNGGNDGDGAQSFVYFVLCGDAVKIGTSTNPRSRVAEMQTGSPLHLKLLAVTPGDLTVERKYHEKFNHLRKGGEWFHAAPELLAYVTDRYGNSGNAKKREVRAEAEAEAEADTDLEAEDPPRAARSGSPPRARVCDAASEPASGTHQRAPEPPIGVDPPELEHDPSLPDEPVVPFGLREESMREYAWRGFARRYEQHTTHPPVSSPDNREHIATLADWLEKLPDPRAACDKTLDAWFADPWVPEHNFPLRNLANNGAKYLAGGSSVNTREALVKRQRELMIAEQTHTDEYRENQQKLKNMRERGDRRAG